jgi:hypothetical protein
MRDYRFTMIPVQLKNDYSAASLSLLSVKVTQFFQDHLPDSNLWMSDVYEWPSYDQNQIIDVVLFGDFFRKFLETGNWIHAKYRFWGLGSPTKNFLTDLGGFKAEQIALIPRHYLYTSQSASLNGLNFDLIYAGRLSSSKRILTLLWTTYYLQKKCNRDVSLTLFGDFILEEKFCSCPTHNPYREEVLRLISDLDWREKPVYRGNLGSHEWPLTGFSNPVFISLSVLPFEDFSVSVAQAQERGWPCILSQWGAHKDILGTTLKIPLPLFESIHETFDSANREGEIIADFISKKNFETNHYTFEKAQVPEIISLQELDEKRRAFLNTWGMNLQDVLRHRTEELRGSKNWSRFMDQYLQCLK